MIQVSQIFGSLLSKTRKIWSNQDAIIVKSDLDVSDYHVFKAVPVIHWNLATRTHCTQSRRAIFWAEEKLADKIHALIKMHTVVNSSHQIHPCLCLPCGPFPCFPVLHPFPDLLSHRADNLVLAYFQNLAKTKKFLDFTESTHTQHLIMQLRSQMLQHVEPACS